MKRAQAVGLLVLLSWAGAACGTRNSLNTGAGGAGAAGAGGTGQDMGGAPGGTGGAAGATGGSGGGGLKPPVPDGGTMPPPDAQTPTGDGPVMPPPPPPPDAGPIIGDGGVRVTGLMALPRIVRLYVGQTATVRILATLSDGSRRDVPSGIDWTMSAPNVVSVMPGTGGIGGYRLQGLGTGTTALVGSFGGQTVQVDVSVRDAILLEVVIEPDRPAVDVGRSQQLTARAHYTGTAEDVTARSQWSSSTPAIATVTAGGLVTCRAVGVATVTATFMGREGGTGVACTGERRLSGLTVQPAVATILANSAHFVAVLAIYSDGTSQDVSDQVTWSSSAPLVAQVEGADVQGRSPGVATITAMYMGYKASTVFTVVSDGPASIEMQPPAATLRPGDGLDLIVLGIYRDGSINSIDTLERWTSSNPTVAQVNDRGFVEARAVGTTTVTATFMSMTATATITVVTARVTSLKLTPANPDLHVGEQAGLLAMAISSDGTSEEVTDRSIWSSSDPKVVIVDRSNGGLIALAAGTATVKAAYQGLEASATVTVRASQPTSLLLSPAMPVVEPGDSFFMQALLVFDDGSSRDVTGSANWRSSNPGVADVDGAGQVTASMAGKATFTANHAGFTSTVMITVSNASLQSVSVTPATASVAAGQTQALRLVGQFDDGTTRDLTGRATWVSSSPGVAAVGSGVGAGLVTGVSAGTTTITASYMSRRATATVTVP